MQHTARSGLLSHLHKLRDDLERVSDFHFIDTDFGNDDGLLAKVAMRKGRDITHFDGQANDSLERGTDCHRQHREKASRKETTPMERIDADDEGV
jgi:hypothetical protein